ncbi:YtxH domain-containing protein [Solitalea koreensis]|uniref:YtxH-like protein n=1 Tax=Solitalea koreensis TaxID=543615 RepID=A0A521DFR6_9SPHI|nr:YtxH domain-containing protein [Solitalea koreensis]SMO69780.1 YtxH-like protein [Solitalea koreensis]
MNNDSKTILAFLAGLAIGSGLGLITAPDKGSALRHRLSETLKRTSNDIIDILNTGINSVKDKFSTRVQEAVDDMGL